MNTSQASSALGGIGTEEKRAAISENVAKARPAINQNPGFAADVNRRRSDAQKTR
jgi:hypothetical protein